MDRIEQTPSSSEKITRAEAEYKVFGGRYSFESGLNPEMTNEDYIESRNQLLRGGKSKVWIVRNFELQNGISADMYFRGVPSLMLLVEFEYGQNSVDVYTNTPGLPGSLVCSGMPFEEAVQAAEEYVDGWR